MKQKSIQNYLGKYEKFQSEITLVYRPDKLSSWSDRCMYGDKDYSYTKKYNHRSILQNEIVIEFDTDLKHENHWYAKQVMELYKKYKIGYSLWTSGNKSSHLHTLVNITCHDLPSFKKAWMQFFTKGLDVEPDYRLCSEAHLIRAENGIHEKTGEYKTLVSESRGYRQSLSEVPKEVWDIYTKNKTKSINTRLRTAAFDLTEHPGVKYILQSEKFRSTNDGRERCLFMLIHILKPKYTKEELTKYLQEWYRYSGGYQLSDDSIARKISYHWDKNYNIGYNYINSILKELRLEKYIKE